MNCGCHASSARCRRLSLAEVDVVRDLLVGEYGRHHRCPTNNLFFHPIITYIAHISQLALLANHLAGRARLAGVGVSERSCPLNGDGNISLRVRESAPSARPPAAPGRRSAAHACAPRRRGRHPRRPALAELGPRLASKSAAGLPLGEVRPRRATTALGARCSAAAHALAAVLARRLIVRPSALALRVWLRARPGHWPRRRPGLRLPRPHAFAELRACSAAETPRRTRRTAGPAPRSWLRSPSSPLSSPSPGRAARDRPAPPRPARVASVRRPSARSRARQASLPAAPPRRSAARPRRPGAA